MFYKGFLDCPFVTIISIIKHIRAILIDISATLKTGKFIGTNSMKSITYPLNNLSNPLPIVPPKRKETPIEIQ